MGWIFLIVIVLFVFFIVRGWRRGFLRVLFSLASIVVLIVVIAFATPYISGFVKGHTNIYPALEERCVQTVQNKAEGGTEGAAGQAEEITGLTLPQKVTSYVSDSGDGAVARTGVYETIGSKMADWILLGASFLIALIIAIIIVRIIGRALGAVNKIPVLGTINKIFGLFAGGVQAYIVVSLLFLFVSLIAGTETGGELAASINSTPLLSYLYNHNFLVTLNLI